MLNRIAEAERRAGAAEDRAREAVESISKPLPDVEVDEIFGDAPGPAAAPDEPEPEAAAEPEPARERAALGGRAGRGPGVLAAAGPRA